MCATVCVPNLLCKLAVLMWAQTTPVPPTWFLLLLLVLGSSTAGNNTCRKVRFATYNTSLQRNADNQLLIELRSGVSAQAANVSAILQTIRADVVLLNEFDYVPDDAAVRAFQHNFLDVSQGPGLEPLRYPYFYTAPVNTGVPSGRDFDHDGTTTGPADAFGYGVHPGQYGMVLLSNFPIDDAAARTFKDFLYKDMPGALLPTDPKTGQPWYSPEDLEVLRLSSKSHWDVPIDIPLGDGVTKRVHMLLHHPTPPAFDGEEGRNLRRNHDEIRLFADYVGCAKCPAPSTPATKPRRSASSGSSQGWSRVKGVACDTASKGFSQLMRKLGLRSEANRVQPEVQDPAAYLYDDAGQHGGIAPGSSFVIAGDHNADPLDGTSYEHAILQLLDCCNITAEFTPTSEGGKEAGNQKPEDRTPPETKTATWDLRVDYILPSNDLRVEGGAVFWPPKAQQPQAGWIEASDHRAVYLDVEVCGEAGPAVS